MPEPGDPQSLNRYSYVRNNPVRYTDPSGHAICVDDECEIVIHPTSGQYKTRRIRTEQYIREKYGIKMVGEFSSKESTIILGGLFDFADKLGGAQNLKRWAEGTLFIRLKGQEANAYAWIISPLPFVSRVFFPDTMFTQDDIGAKGTVVHELAHRADMLASFPPTSPLNTHVPKDGLRGIFASKSASELLPDQDRSLTAYSQKNPQEYWAEAVAIWVYGQEYDNSRNPLTVQQEEFIHSFFGGDHAP